jgi:hypothetical protein
MELWVASARAAQPPRRGPVNLLLTRTRITDELHFDLESENVGVISIRSIQSELEGANV